MFLKKSSKSPHVRTLDMQMFWRLCLTNDYQMWITNKQTYSRFQRWRHPGGITSKFNWNNQHNMFLKFYTFFFFFLNCYLHFLIFFFKASLLPFSLATPAHEGGLWHTQVLCCCKNIDTLTYMRLKGEHLYCWNCSLPACATELFKPNTTLTNLFWDICLSVAHLTNNGGPTVILRSLHFE